MAKQNKKEKSGSNPDFLTKEEKILLQKQKKKEYDSHRRLVKKVEKDFENGKDSKYSFIFRPTKKRKTDYRLENERAVFAYLKKKHSFSEKTIKGIFEKISPLKSSKKNKKITWLKYLDNNLTELSEIKKNPYYEIVYFQEFNDFFDPNVFINYNGEIIDKKAFMLKQRMMLMKLFQGFLYYRIGVQVGIDENELKIYKINQDSEAIIKASNSGEKSYRDFWENKKEDIINTDILFES